MTAKEEIMMKHCVPTGLLEYSKGKSILDAMDEYAKQKAWEAWLAATELIWGPMSPYGVAKTMVEFKKHWEENK